MSRLNWGAVGERLYEAGVDRGVLFVNGLGVVWNGLVSVSENPSGAETKAYHVDGYKYLNRIPGEEFEATIEAYTYPEEFAQCDGTAPVRNGLFATQQKRKSFGLAYRTKIGNDVNGVDHGYKIHLVYNAKAAPSTRSNATISAEVDPANFSWQIFTRPPAIEGFKPAAHFVIDSRETPREVMTQIEDILYGTDETDPRLPVIRELVYIFNSYDPSFFDAGQYDDPFYVTFDAGVVPAAQTSTIDGGMP